MSVLLIFISHAQDASGILAAMITSHSWSIIEWSSAFIAISSGIVPSEVLCNQTIVDPLQEIMALCISSDRVWLMAYK